MTTPVTETTTTTVNPPLPPPRQTTSMKIWTIWLGLFAEQLGQSWCYSFPVVAIKTIWNLAYVVFSLVMLILTVNEKPNMPLRGWILVYSLHCVVRVLLLWLEYTKRNTRVSTSSVAVIALFRSSERLEDRNTLFLQIWLFIGYILIYRIGETPPPDAPRLFWLTLAFVASDVFFGFIRAGCSVISFPFIKVPRVATGPGFSERVVIVQDPDCCICLCNCEDGPELYSLPCNHHFHTLCILNWLMIKGTCPLCKRETNW